MKSLESMMKEQYNVFTLPSGLRCVHWHTGTHVEYCGLAIGAGSANDPVDRPGLAHFVEHTLFKGTRKRSPWHISNRMESVGGDINAYTSKEETMLYTSAPIGWLARSIELLADIVGNSIFPEAELAKEKEVVIEEIKSYLDSPSDNVYDIFEDMIFSGTSLGHNILGTPESVNHIASAECRRFIDTYYVPANMVLYVASPQPCTKVEKLVSHHMGGLHHPFAATATNEFLENDGTLKCVPTFKETMAMDVHQAHTVMGSRLFSRNDARRYALFLFNNYLGGPCMSSLLNRELRDKRGYVYTVDSNVALLRHTGLITIYFGTDSRHTPKCLELVKREIEKLAASPLSERIFERARRQYLGQLCVASDNRENQAMSLAKSVLYYDEIHDINYVSSQISAVTTEDVRNIAALMLECGFSSLTIN